MNQRREILKQCLSENVSKIVSKLSDEAINSIEEIRIRTGRGVSFKGYNAVCKITPSDEDMKEILLRMSDFSVYAHMHQLRQGFITLKGGHRVGIVGRCVVEGEKIQNITEISSICIRLAKQIKGAADNIVNVTKDSNVLIVSPPGCGKTTMLRDLARQLGKWYNISLIDERCEIAACVDGVPQLDVGEKTDVISCCPKSIAIPLSLRTMAPDLVMTDELYGEDDISCITRGCSMGVRVVATAHGSSFADVKSRMNTDIFSKIVILDSYKRIVEVI